MSMTECKTCSGKISKNTKICPHCGENRTVKNDWKFTVYVLLLFYGSAFIYKLIVGDKIIIKSESMYNPVSQMQKKERRTILKGGYFACTTETLFDEITAASINKDNLAIGHLLSRGCVLTKEGVRMSVIDLGIETSKVRAYSGSDSVVLYTNTENVYY